MQVVDSINQEFGEWVRSIRKAEGLTQEELASKMGIASTYLSRIETGDRPPTEPFCIALAGVFGFPIYTVLVRARLVEESDGFAEANTLKKNNETEDSDVWEFKRRIARIKDKAERERILDSIWALLDVATRRSARSADQPENGADIASGKGKRSSATAKSDAGRPPVPHR